MAVDRRQFRADTETGSWWAPPVSEPWPVWWRGLGGGAGLSGGGAWRAGPAAAPGLGGMAGAC